MRHWTLALVCLLAACVSERSSVTQITLRIGAEDAIAARATRVEVQIAAREQGVYEPGRTLRFDRPGLRFPFDLPVMPGRGKSESGAFELVVRASDAAGPLAEARVLTNFVPDAQKLLVIELAACGELGPAAVCDNPAGCFGESCQTCVDGMCRPTPTRPGESLPDLTDTLPGEDSPDAATSLPTDAGSSGSFDAGEEIAVEQDPARCETSRKAAFHPFGLENGTYAAPVSFPSHVYRSERNDLVAATYLDWRNAYLVPGGCSTNSTRVIASGDPMRSVTSEAQGVAMLVVALMAGYDETTHTQFDELLRYVLDHPAKGAHFLMARSQSSACRDVDTGSASDGDLDIAYSLLIADKQWGSSGEFDYRSIARTMLAEIRRRDVDADGRYMLLGSGVDKNDSHYDGTRTSDFMPGHMTTFGTVRDEEFWRMLRQRGYAMVESLQANYAATTGLLPDFAEGMNSAGPKPASPGFFLDAQNDDYGVYASRTPLRIALDYVTSGSTDAQEVVERMNGWMNDSTDGDPTLIRAGYRLDGTPVQQTTSMAFVAPLGVSAMVSPRRDWLNALWDTLSDSTRRDNRFMGDTLRMLSLIVMSGNWFRPEAVECPEPEPAQPVDAGTVDAEIGESNCWYPDWSPELLEMEFPVQHGPRCLTQVMDELPRVALGFHDAGNVQGMTWALEAADRAEAKFTFFVTCAAGQSPEVLELWRRAARAGHEIAVAAQDTLPGDANADPAAWEAQIRACSTYLRDNGLADEFPFIGFRAPGHVYGDASLSAVRASGLFYDSSIVEGMQPAFDGLDFYHPYTLDYESPGHTDRVVREGVRQLGAVPGQWELPLYAVLAPPNLRRGLEKRSGWFTTKLPGDDFLFWSAAPLGLAMTEDEVVESLVYTLERRIRGNRAPITLALSTERYADGFAAPSANTTQRRRALERFLERANQLDVVLDTHARVMRWVRAPATPLPPLP